jgi:hypothetical protein
MHIDLLGVVVIRSAALKDGVQDSSDTVVPVALTIPAAAAS